MDQSELSETLWPSTITWFSNIGPEIARSQTSTEGRLPPTGSQAFRVRLFPFWNVKASSAISDVENHTAVELALIT
jgi:hypothetical protein